MEPKWRMSKKRVMEDLLCSELETLKFLNVLISLPNKWKLENPQPFIAQQTSIKVAVFKTYTKTCLQIITCRAPPQQSTSWQSKNVHSIQNTWLQLQILKVLSRDTHSIFSQKIPWMELRWLSLLIQLINMLQELLVSTTSFSTNGRVRNTQMFTNNGCGTRKNRV